MIGMAVRRQHKNGSWCRALQDNLEKVKVDEKSKGSRTQP